MNSLVKLASQSSQVEQSTRSDDHVKKNEGRGGPIGERLGGERAMPMLLAWSVYVLLLALILTCGTSGEAELELPTLVASNELTSDEDRSAVALSEKGESSLFPTNEQQQRRIEELERRLQQLERLVSSGKFGQAEKWEMAEKIEKALKEISGWVVNSIPPTDKECSFDWKSLSCSPSCSCMLQPKVGDLSLSRACRLRSPQEIDPACVGHHPEPTIVHKAVDMALEVLANQSFALLSALESYSPVTDEDCKWSWKKMRCYPTEFCTLDPQLGDFSLHRACRLRTDIED